MPGSWKSRTDLHKEAQLQVGNGRQECYLIVLSEDKSAFGKLDYEGHSKITSQNTISKLSGGKIRNTK